MRYLQSFDFSGAIVRGAIGLRRKVALTANEVAPARRSVDNTLAIVLEIASARALCASRTRCLHQAQTRQMDGERWRGEKGAGI